MNGEVCVAQVQRLFELELLPQLLCGAGAYVKHARKRKWVATIGVLAAVDLA